MDIFLSIGFISRRLSPFPSPPSVSTSLSISLSLSLTLDRSLNFIVWAVEYSIMHWMDALTEINYSQHCIRLHSKTSYELVLCGVWVSERVVSMLFASNTGEFDKMLNVFVLFHVFRIEMNDKRIRITLLHTPHGWWHIRQCSHAVLISLQLVPCHE